MTETGTPIGPGQLDSSELRPALLRTYKEDTLDCYRRRLVHYQKWCQQNGYQPSADQITTEKTFDYVREQINRWNTETADAAPTEYRLLRPDTVKQAVNALIYHAERAGVKAPEDREAKELIRRWTDTFNRATPPAYQVTGRQSPRPRHREVPRPSRPVEDPAQEALFSTTA